jgi:hypothetical protein
VICANRLRTDCEPDLANRVRTGCEPLGAIPLRLPKAVGPPLRGDPPAIQLRSGFMSHPVEELI